MSTIKLTENFALSEFACGCGCDRHEQPEIVAALRRLCERRLQPIRDALGVSLRVHSGVRCEAYNKRCGGARRSQHLFGVAADLVPHGGDIAAVGREARAIIAALGCGGVKEYHRTTRISFCHVDDRRTTWDGNR